MTTQRIELLSPSVVSKIAAGEVVERPASVVKELLENSLDAGASTVDIDLLEGGRELIRVVDDGMGISPEDLPLAVTSHATSKIRTDSDLFQIPTFGFRGEALASVAGISDFRIQSRPPRAECAACLEVRQGEISEVEQCAGPVGTQIEVRNLFSTIPVRRKFLKNKQTELGHVHEAVLRLAMANPGRTLTLRHHDRVILKRPSDMSFADLVESHFGSDVRRGLIEINREIDGYRLTGYVAEPSVSRPHSKLQYLYVNDRFIRDRSLTHAVQEAYRGLLLSGRYPIVFLFLRVPPDQVDVNVHPTKIEVRFEDPRRIYSLILSSLRDQFLRADLAARWSPPSETPSYGAPEAGSATDRRASHQKINEEFALTSSRPTTQPSLWTPARSALPAPSAHMPASPSIRPTREDWQEAFAPLPPPLERSNETRVMPSPDAPPPAPPVAALVETMRALQLHHSYLVVETSEGMLLVDQHALHERILYEQLRQRIAGESVEVQKLLVPEPVDLPPSQVGLLVEAAESLARLGVLIDEFGERCILVQGVPAMLRKTSPSELVKSIAHRLEDYDQPPTRDQLLEDMLQMVACKAAVKAGDPLTPSEIDALLRQRELVEDSHHCPHGRPTVLRFTLGDLERQFQRK